MTVYSIDRMKRFFTEVSSRLGGDSDDQVKLAAASVEQNARSWHSDWRRPRGEFEVCQLLYDQELRETADISSAVWVVLAQRRQEYLSATIAPIAPSVKSPR